MAARGPALGGARGMMRTVVAGFGSELNGDDGVGVAVVRRLAREGVPAGVRCVDVGNAGIRLVHELLDGCDRVVIVDALHAGAPPGTVLVIHPRVPDPSALSPEQRSRLRVDAHLAEPSRALLMARALGVLPGDVHLVGVEPAETEAASTDLTPPVEAAMATACARVRALLVAGAEAR